LKGVGKIFSKIFLTGVWGRAPQTLVKKQKTEINRLDIRGKALTTKKLKINKRQKLSHVTSGVKRYIIDLFFNQDSK
jgi:hypothetical protein